MTDLIHAYDLKYGSIYIYSPNLDAFRPYIENITTNIENVFQYCKNHHINACYVSDHPVIGFYEYLIVHFVMKRFGIANDKQKFSDFIEDNYPF